MIVHESASKSKQGYKILDDDGLANLFFMTSLTSGMSDDKIKTTLTTPFKESLNKAIGYCQKRLESYSAQIKDPTTDPPKKIKLQAREKKYAEVIAEMQNLAKIVDEQNGVSRKEFGALMNKVIGPISNITGYEYSKYTDGKFEKRPKAERLTEILGEEVYNSVARISVNGEYAQTRGCDVKGTLIDPQMHPDPFKQPSAQ